MLMKVQEKEQKNIREHLKPVVTQPGPLSKPLKDPEQTEERRRENVTTSPFPVSKEYLRNSGGSSINIISLLPTR